MNRQKEKPYLEFGGNAFYINLESILDVIKINNQDYIMDAFEKLPPSPPVKETKGKTSRKKKVEDVESTDEEIEFLAENTGIQIDISKWEVLRLMIDAIMNINPDVDDKLGIAGLNNNSSIPFKIAFNTLLKYDILQEEE